MKRTSTLLFLALALGACGGSDDAGSSDDAATPEPSTSPAPAPSSAAAPTGPMTMPDWFQWDEAGNSVHLTLVAGQTSRNNYWNYNGHIRGEIAINVPAGATVTIDLVNEDPNMKHSVGVSSELSNFTVPPDPTPVFEGAITDNPTSMIEGGMPGETQTITFVADTAGNYTLVCYVPGHSAVGMWIYFNVTADGAAGVQGL